MRKTIFTKSMKILIISLLLLAVFFRKERSQKLMALAFILWAVVTVGILLFRQSGKLFKKCRALCSALKQKIGQMMESPEEIPSPFPVQEGLFLKRRREPRNGSVFRTDARSPEG